MKQDNKYKMKRDVVTASSFAEADNHVTYWEDKTPMERLQAACFIINNLYNVTAATKIRKDIMTERKHS
jgi:hypothetical protein